MKSLIFTSLLSLSTRAFAQTASAQFDGISYAINIPEDTVSNGQGDIFLQMTAPADLQWFALGQGSSMRGANMFVVYSSSDGNNVTVSPRLGIGTVEPRFNPDAQITLLEGSGISNGQMVANFKCSSCHSWDGGSMDFTQDSVTWIHAARTGQSLNSDDTSAQLTQHNAGNDAFDWNIASAKGGNSVNPFAQAAPPTPGQSPTNNADMPAVDENRRARLIAHGTVAALAVVVFFPFGAISLRLFNFPGLVWFHAAVQVLSYLMLTAGVGLGIYIARTQGYLWHHHPIIGLVLFSVLFFQAFGGILHHIQFKKTGKRSVVSHGHIWLGRLTITLGIINGGLGIRLAANTTTGQKAAYGVVAGVIWLVWMASAAYGEAKRRRTPVQFDGAARAGDNASNGRDSQEKSVGSH